MIFAVDFLVYFEQTGPLLDMDDTLWCVSTWNDNGFALIVNDSKALFRTSFFPGLGWMLKKSLWEEVTDIMLDH
jgi:alpha-1,3-mannosyl-glycoprotein beta-1,2-N-acetylglucosaminyltransferase